MNWSTDRRPAHPAEPASRVRTKIRCAIYTRKSTEEGLEQEFNSLDAQRESAQAYIESQRHEGWVCLPERYDDGGFSGGNMDRPALKRLFADIETGKIDCVVVYKVDRMSRAILDFAKIIDLFDQHKVSFVSVTQQFNTTNSMGRLTLNILLSFAQFEREIISERTRDKMSAARRKGKWIGGHPMLGYDVHPQGGRLVVNEAEAEQVRAIFQLYLERQTLMAVVEELEAKGWTAKRWITKKGRQYGGAPFTKASLHRLLTNRTYTGNIEFKGTVYEGEHEAIVDDDLWQRVQAVLRRNRMSGCPEIRNKYGALLKGILFCVPCRTGMGHSYTKRSGKIYRYYVCLNAQQQCWATCPTKSVNANDIETAVIQHIRGIGRNEELIAAIAAKIREKGNSRLSDLETEQRIGARELERLNARVQKLVGESFAPGATKSLAIDHLADLQDRIRAMEKRMVAIGEEILAIQRQALRSADLENALEEFDPVWEALSPREKAQILHLLIERIGYNGRDGKVTVTFRSPQVKALCSGTETKQAGLPN